MIDNYYYKITNKSKNGELEDIRVSLSNSNSIIINILLIVINELKRVVFVVVTSPINPYQSQRVFQLSVLLILSLSLCDSFFFFFINNNNNNNNGERWISKRWSNEKDRIIVHIRSDMDLPKFHSNRLQQIHLRQKDVQLAIPNFPNYDPHVFLCNPSYSPRSHFQISRTCFNVSRRLLLLRRSYRCSLLSLSMALKFRLHLSLCLLYSNA